MFHETFEYGSQQAIVKHGQTKFALVTMFLCLGFVSRLDAYQETLVDSAITFRLDLHHGKKLQEYHGTLFQGMTPDEKLILCNDVRPELFYSVYDVDTGREICRIKRSNPQLLHVSNDERRGVILYTPTASRLEKKGDEFCCRIGLFCLETGKEIHSWPSIRLDLGNTTPFQGYFSPNSKYLLILAGTTTTPKVLVVEAISGKTAKEYKLGYFRPVAISKDHRFAALATPERHTLYLDLNTNQSKILPYYPIEINDNGRWLLAIDEKNTNQTPIMLDTKTGKVTKEIPGLEIGMCNRVFIAPDGKTVWNNTTLWSSESGKALTHVKQRSVAFYSALGEFVYLDCGILLKSKTGNLVWNLARREKAISFSENASSLLLKDGTIMSVHGNSRVSKINHVLQGNSRETGNGTWCSTDGELKYVDIRDGAVLCSVKENSFLSSSAYKAHSFVMSKDCRQVFITYRKADENGQK